MYLSFTLCLCTLFPEIRVRFEILYALRYTAGCYEQLSRCLKLRAIHFLP